MSDLLKKIHSLNLELNHTAANQFRYTTLESKKNAEDEQEEGGTDTGSITLSVEQMAAYLQACFTQQRRQGEKKWGPVPFTEDPNLLLGKKRRLSRWRGKLPSSHPLLARSQQFSGDDPKLTANPEQNEQAKERYPQLRNENRLRQSNSLRRRKSVTLSR
jgi:hypothetical protein